MRSSHTSAHLQKKSTCFSSWTSPHSHLSQILEPPCHLQDSTLKWGARNLNLLKFLNTCLSKGVTRGYKDGLQPESLADANWLVKQNQPVSKIETKSDTNLRSLYESWFRNAMEEPLTFKVRIFREERTLLSIWVGPWGNRWFMCTWGLWVGYTCISDGRVWYLWWAMVFWQQFGLWFDGTGEGGREISFFIMMGVWWVWLGFYSVVGFWGVVSTDKVACHQCWWLDRGNRY